MTTYNHIQEFFDTILIYAFISLAVILVVIVLHAIALAVITPFLPKPVKVHYRMGDVWVAKIEAGSVKNAVEIINAIAPSLPVVRKLETDVNNSSMTNEG